LLLSSVPFNQLAMPVSTDCSVPALAVAASMQKVVVLKEQLHEANQMNCRLEEEMSLAKKAIQSEKSTNQYAQNSLALMQQEVPTKRLASQLPALPGTDCALCL
jgi:oligoribonuclease (3'-5' exoribonuclease)